MGERFRDNHRLTTLDRPDITPLVDLTFLLLIVFMITAPTLEYAVDVSPPELNADPVQPDRYRLVNVDRSGAVYIDDRQVAIRDLAARLAGSEADTQIFIRADQERQWGEVMAVMRVVRAAGFVNVSFVTQEEQ